MDTIVYIVFIYLRFISYIFPLGLSRFIAKFYAMIFYYIIPIRKKVARQNIKLCFPNFSDKEINAVIKNTYKNILTVITEFIYFPRFSDDKIKKLINITNPELITNKLKEGKGLILVGGHFGNWELMAFGVSRIVNEPFNVIVKEQTNKKIDKAINNIREMHGNKMIEMKTALRDVLKLLKENKVLAMIGDQSAPSESAAKVNFFVPDVPMFEGAARFAIKTSSPVAFGVSFRNDDGTYSITLHDISIDKYKEYNDENVRALTQEHASLLENAIKECPGHWLWFHRKFK
ncbi:MAG: lysophospholipid acyltransferase family protein, partial [Ignavibacteria bacterium]